MLSPVKVPEHLMTAAAVPSLERQQVLAELGSSGRGLSADEAAARRAEIGANQLPAPRRRPVLAEFGAQFANMFAVVLMVAAGITFVAYALATPRSSVNLVLAIGILGVVLLNAGIGFAQEHAAERTAEALQALVPATAQVIRDGELTEIPAVDLVPGDLVMLDAGDATAATGGLVIFVHASGSSRHSPRNQFVAVGLNRAGLGTLLIDLLTPDEELSRANVFNVVLDLNQRAHTQLKCESRLAVVPGATHLFSEPGALGQVPDLAVGWFGRYLAWAGTIPAAA
jgi:Cation transporter/ATPase, N-terminus/E1-E2 ATPase